MKVKQGFSNRVSMSWQKLSIKPMREKNPLPTVPPGQRRYRASRRKEHRTGRARMQPAAPVFRKNCLFHVFLPGWFIKYTGDARGAPIPNTDKFALLPETTEANFGGSFPRSIHWTVTPDMIEDSLANHIDACIKLIPTEGMPSFIIKTEEV